MKKLPFESRNAAGRLLAECLQARRRQQDPLVMAVPPGGVPVAFEVARVLDAELDLMMVRKLGLPSLAGFSMGAVAGGGIALRNHPLIREAEIGDEEYRDIHAFELIELQHHEILYRGFRPAPRIEGRSVILVDDGLSSGSAMRAAIRYVRRFDPLEIVVALPVASAVGIELVAPDADEVVCLAIPDPFLSIGLCYRDFPSVCDNEVCTTLQDGWREATPGSEMAINGAVNEWGGT